MMVEVIRIEKSDHGVRGVMRIDGRAVCLTLEDADRQNQSMVSCIPTGLYMCERRQSPKFGEVFEVMNVPGRTSILIHAGNTEEDTHGCILLGSRFGTTQDLPAVFDSKLALMLFMSITKGEQSVALRISEV